MPISRSLLKMAFLLDGVFRGGNVGLVVLRYGKHNQDYKP